MYKGQPFRRTHRTRDRTTSEHGYLGEDLAAVPVRTLKNNVMAALRLAAPGPANLRPDVADDIPVALAGGDQMVEARAHAVDGVPGAAPPHIYADPDARRNLKAEAASFTHILRHMPFNKY